MKKVYGSDDRVEIAQLRAVLEANHIACIVRNDFLGGAAGELPMMECWPEIWVMENFQHERARALVDAYLRGNAPGAPWVCPQCDEPIDAPFSQCWQCGHERESWELPS